MTSFRRFNKAATAGWNAAWSYEAQLAEAYAGVLKGIYDAAASDLDKLALTAAGRSKRDAAPDWHKPHIDELTGRVKEVYRLDKKTGPIRVEAMRAATTPALETVGLDFTLTNPFVKDVLLTSGKSIDIVDTTRDDIMRSLNESYEKGHSVKTAAKAIRELGLDKARSLLIARTELNAISNGGSWAAAMTSVKESEAGGDNLPPLLKIWLTAEDERVRDTHVEAGDAYGSGNGIPLDQAFSVGDYDMQHPGDPDAGPEEVCNCRCALSYEEGESVTAAARSTIGARMTSIPGIPDGAVPLGTAISDGREFVTCLCMEGMATSDHRFIAVDAIAWRPLPLTITAQLITDSGHDNAVVAGKIERIDKMPAAAAIAAGLIPEDRDYPAEAVAVIGYGCFANTYEGDQVMGLVADEMLRGVSVELAVIEGELVELPPAEGQEYGDLLDVTVKAEIAAACIVAFPAFAEAQIMLASKADSGGLTTEPADDGDEALAASAWSFSVITASPLKLASQVRPATRFAAVDHTDGSMIAVHPTAEQAAACGQPGGQPPGDMHVTLAYLPNPQGVDFAALHKLVAKVAADSPAMQGEVVGAGYFGPKPEVVADAPKPEPGTKESDGMAAHRLAQAILADDPAAPETDSGEGGSSDQPAAEAGDDPEGKPLHPHVALVDAPGLSTLRQKLCQAMDDAGVEYSQNHDFTPHMTLGYEEQPGTPAVHLAGQPLSFSHLTVHEGATKTDHPMQAPDSLTASAAGAAPVKPPMEWFYDPELSEPTGLTVTPEGRIFGHIATWGTCHIGIMDACVRPPRNQSGYRMFHLGELETEEGEFIAVGTLTMATGHASLKLSAHATKRHYDDTGVAAADVVAGEDRHGIWIAGAVRPDLSMARVRELRGSKPSGDWRMIGGAFEMMGILAVNTPGFPVPRPKARVLAASAAEQGQRVTALVAAGIDLQASDDGDTNPAELWRLFDLALPGSSAEKRDALLASVL